MTEQDEAMTDPTLTAEQFWRSVGEWAVEQHIWKREARPEQDEAVRACLHPSISPMDPWPDGPSWACDQCGVPFTFATPPPEQDEAVRELIAAASFLDPVNESVRLVRDLAATLTGEGAPR